jgi:AAA domain
MSTAPDDIGTAIAREVYGGGDLLSEFRVDLIERIREGIPEREFVPGCEEWLIRGKRYLLFASAGVGKSLAVLVAAVEVVAQGGKVVIFDVENGSDEYARRLEDVLQHRNGDLMDACQERLRYYEFPTLKLDWTPEEWARSIDGADLVIFDSSRMALSSVGLSEDANDDYAAFVNALGVPLARANSAVLILDNVGHGDGGHPRGASAKGDLNEVVFELSAVEPFDRDTRGKVIWRRKRQRFSGVPVAMEQVIGGGAFELPKPLAQDRDADPREFRPTGKMEKVSQVVEAEPGCSTNFIEEHVKGKKEYTYKALQVLLAEGYIRREDGPNRSHLHYSITPYREAEDTENGGDPGWFPGAPPGAPQASGLDPSQVSPPSGSLLKGGTTGGTGRPSDSPSGPRGTTEPPPDSDHPLFGAGVEETDPPAQSSEDGHHHFTEGEYAERWRARQERLGDG